MTGSLTDLNNVEATLDLFRSAAEAMRGSACRTGSVVRLPRRGTLLITGDLHDQLDHWYRILHLAQLEASPDQHVLLQELIHGDRMVNGLDFSYRMLARVAELVLAHPDQVHVVIGNHELAQMTRRAVSKGAGNSVERFDGALEWVYGDEAETVADAINKFILAMPLAVQTESGLMCSHSLPSVDRMSAFEPDVFDRELQPADYEGTGSSVYLLTWGRVHEDEQLESFAEQLGVKTFCIGHQSVREGVRRDGPRLLVINSDHASGVAIPWGLDLEPEPAAMLEAAVYLQTVGIDHGASQ